MNQPIGGVDPWADEQTDEGAGAAGGAGGVEDEGAGDSDAGQAKTLNPNRMQLSSGRWVVPDGKGGWKDE